MLALGWAVAKVTRLLGTVPLGSLYPFVKGVYADMSEGSSRRDREERLERILEACLTARVTGWEWECWCWVA